MTKDEAMAQMELLARLSAAFDWFIAREGIIEREEDQIIVTWSGEDGRRRAVTVIPAPDGKQPLLACIIAAHKQALRM